MEHQEMIVKSKRWRSVYPHYIEQTISQAEGRRVARNVAVPNITINEMAEALQKIRVPTVVEVHKSYPRNAIIKGRVKVMIFDEDNQIVNPTVVNKKVLLKLMCQEIMKTDERQKNPQGKPHPSRIDYQQNKMEEEKKEVAAQTKDKAKGKKGRK